MKDYTKFKSYLDDRVRHYPFIHDMVLFYKGLIDIWSGFAPDDLSLLFKSPSALAGKGEQEVLYLMDTTRLGDLDFNNSIRMSIKIFRLFEAGRQGGNIIECAGSSEEAVLEFIREGLSKDDRFKNAVLKWILKPSFENTLARLNVDNSPAKGRCPVCGAPPAMAIVYTPEDEKAEQRLLSCCFCTYRWQYPMTGCPFCGNSRPERFGLIVGDSARDQCVRAVSCEECRTYLKTVFTGCRSDKKKPDDLDMDIEDVATLNLDIMADQRGYTALCQHS
ncbi:MAG: formate dehydrogenase accessory protein FdhE [Nitrospirae bacterium]|nr:formate dehydrogenase accessory protein FdhE [Nitrospirota bacterium]